VPENLTARPKAWAVCHPLWKIVASHAETSSHLGTISRNSCRCFMVYGRASVVSSGATVTGPTRSPSKSLRERPSRLPNLRNKKRAVERYQEACCIGSLLRSLYKARCYVQSLNQYAPLYQHTTTTPHPMKAFLQKTSPIFLNPK